MKPEIRVQVLASRILARCAPELGRALGLRPEHRALALLTADCDDAAYIALDEATKAASVEVVYARSLYAGASNASTPLAGEVVGILAGAGVPEVQAGLARAVAVLGQVGFRPCGPRPGVVCLAHCIARSGTFLSARAHTEPGSPLAYLIAPPLEALWGLDRALKTAAVEIGAFYGPPTETNFAGALLRGSESACRAACSAFAQAVEEMARMPLEPSAPQPN